MEDLRCARDFSYRVTQSVCDQYDLDCRHTVDTAEASIDKERKSKSKS